ncbi:hypothetical protein F5882DRAFT_418864 [Hyaloscypha sp. PMI_1271]|nr:hypothetical protein F5882DRAFT_418864 [Hyaloscypha sp. PMI_1271]
MELSNHAPDSEKVDRMALNLCRVFDELMELFFGSSSDESSQPTLKWTQYMNLGPYKRQPRNRRETVHTIVGVELSKTKQELESEGSSFTHRLMRAILSLSYHQYGEYFKGSNLGALETLRVLGHCRKEDLGTLMQEFGNQLGSNLPLYSWNRGPRGDLSDISYHFEMRYREYIFLGMRFSSVFEEGPTDHTYEIFCRQGAKNHLQHLASDLFSSFLLELLVQQRQQNPDSITRISLKLLTSILVKHKICINNHDARMAILPAVIQSQVRDSVRTLEKILVL